ncbi:hypothetical protein SG34_010125 [Thalassomonas viridans]|uniref:Uncharacterized protein n=1 Tax=Thalassomonas viridans TaxID=137584 RepID=A0AAE9Z5N2_9GAMM|nr:hypothetical protein [Thalassomonas viridans]WDE07211.1 hypothetical protein SG34_010125 [Thalassomonas viridans]
MTALSCLNFYEAFTFKEQVSHLVYSEGLYLAEMMLLNPGISMLAIANGGYFFLANAADVLTGGVAAF